MNDEIEIIFGLLPIDCQYNTDSRISHTLEGLVSILTQPKLMVTFMNNRHINSKNKNQIRCL